MVGGAACALCGKQINTHTSQRARFVRYTRAAPKRMTVRFSERMGYTKVRSALQLESVDEVLRNRLWNVVCMFCFPDAPNPESLHTVETYPITNMFLRAAWHSFLRRPTDEVPWLWRPAYQNMKSEFKILEWYKVYDFLEFIRNGIPNGRGIDTVAFVSACNKVLEEETSGYRFVGNEIAQIIDAEEIAAVEEALSSGGQSDPVQTHLTRALELFADRQNPDYRNSIKESISAVEASCQLATGDKKATLGDALKKLRASASLHPALETAFQKLYGYTNDADGIRHALKEGSSLSLADAKFMLVVSSAFINLLRSKLPVE